MNSVIAKLQLDLTESVGDRAGRVIGFTCNTQAFTGHCLMNVWTEKNLQFQAVYSADSMVCPFTLVEKK